MELTRSAHEDVEHMEKAMSAVLMDKGKNLRHQVSVEHGLHYLVNTTVQKAKSILEIYQDKDGMRNDDINALAGQRGDKKQSDVWTSFYDRVKEVKDYNRRPGVNQGQNEVQNSAWFYQRAFEADISETLFTGEEDMGRRVDMHDHFSAFTNLKKISKERHKKARNATYARLKKKLPDLQFDEPEVEEAFQKEFAELDYVEWLKTFDQFHEIPRFCKHRDANYREYLESLVAYQRDLLVRTQPLVDVAKLVQQFDKEFDERWNEKNIPGWQEPTHKDPFFSLPTKKLFVNEASMKSHKGGKLYKKKVAIMQKMSFEEQNKLIEVVEAEDRCVARLESHAAKWHDLLHDTINETVMYLQKKQSQTVEEMEADREAESDDEEFEDDGMDIDSDMEKDDEDRPIYNPLNLPLGWDGKPIPFWLYKLHGLGIEYRCEICGNYSYWGRRAFERHFSEWRHAFGMRCLKIPNTSHFKEITKIEDAITLYDKLKKDAEEQTFRPDQDVECEDIQGNVMSQRAFEDLRRQGLV